MQRNPYGGIQLEYAKGSVKALNTFSGAALRTLCNDILFPDMIFFIVQNKY
jgi:hypothetical protein